MDSLALGLLPIDVDILLTLLSEEGSPHFLRRHIHPLEDAVSVVCPVTSSALAVPALL